MDESGGRFRRGYSKVSNAAMWNKDLSLKAKGLYGLIQTYLSMDNFTLYKGFLIKQSKDGKKSFEGSWNELKETGYLVQHKLKDERGYYYYEYDLLDTPISSASDQQSNVRRIQTPKREDMDFEDMENREDGKGVRYSNKNNGNKNITNKIIPNQIISEDDVKEQIGYDRFALNNYSMGQVDDIVLLMVEVFNANDSDQFRINSHNVSAAVVKSRYRKLEYEHIEYILMSLQDFTNRISNMRSYLLTTLFNAPSTINHYYQNRVMNDMYGNG